VRDKEEEYALKS